jgi:hypothetical protein
LEVTDGMREHAFPYIAAISREVSPTEGEHVGSGLYLALRKAVYLLTNEHVARSIKVHPLGHQLAANEYAVRVSNAVQVARSPYDLAVTRIDPQTWSDAKNQRLALPIERVALKHEPVDEEFLFTMGYSDERSYFSPTLETLFSRGTPYLTQASKAPPAWLSDMCFAMPYAPDLARSMDPKGRGLPNPHGLSGAPVWDTNFRRCNLEPRPWKAEYAQVTGVVFSWDPSTAHVIAIRVEYVREFLLFALRVEAAYFRWIDRGRPYGDDLTDWVWAEGAICNL